MTKLAKIQTMVMSILFPKYGGKKLVNKGVGGISVLKIGLGPPSTDFGSIWSSPKARKFQHFPKSSKVRILYSNQGLTGSRYPTRRDPKIENDWVPGN